MAILHKIRHRFQNRLLIVIFFLNKGACQNEYFIIYIIWNWKIYFDHKLLLK